MGIEGLQFLHLVNIMDSFVLDFRLTTPEVGISCQVFRFNSHLDDFTVLLESPEDVSIDHPSIVDVLKMFVFLIHLPISE